MSIKRLKYFTGQFLKENDFRDEQSYHINALLMHNRNLHSWGIASGLDVSFDETRKYVILEEGMAIDGNGMQILLEKPMKITFLNISTAVVYLTISLKTTETDLAEANEFSGNTRISEEAFIELDRSMPDDGSLKIFLAKITLNAENKTVMSIDKSKRKVIGFSAKNMVGLSQIKDESITVPKIKSNKNVVTVEGTLESNAEKRIAVEESNIHLFLVTSVICTSEEGQIEWRWRTIYKNNQLSYELWLKNLSDKPVDYDAKYFDIAEK